MGRRHTIDPSDVGDGVRALLEMSPRKHNDDRTVTRSCRCGALVVVPQGHDALDDEHEQDVRCHDCDLPTGVKAYRAIAKHR
jgi:hypothetical protein